MGLIQGVEQNGISSPGNPPQRPKRGLTQQACAQTEKPIAPIRGGAQHQIPVVKQFNGQEKIKVVKRRQIGTDQQSWAGGKVSVNPPQQLAHPTAKRTSPLKPDPISPKLHSPSACGTVGKATHCEHRLKMTFPSEGPHHGHGVDRQPTLELGRTPTGMA